MAANEVEGVRLDEEFALSAVGDGRRQRRLVGVARAFDVNPEASFPEAMRTDAALEAAYRLLRNKAVSIEGILAGHYRQTVDRAAAEQCVLAIHDTTIFDFPGEATREGLGPLRGKGQGFLAHFSLLVTPGELRRPLGVVSLQTIVRKTRAERDRKKPRTPAGESKRWFDGVQMTDERIGGRCSVIHVMDREGDSYELWSNLVASNRRFVIRNGRDRLLADNATSLSEALERPSQNIIERLVALSPRKEKKIIFNRRRHPARTGRLARLALSAQQMTFQRPRTAGRGPDTLTLNVVHVREIETNGTNDPVQWTLVTNEPIATPQDIERIVDTYRSRWVIETAQTQTIKPRCGSRFTGGFSSSFVNQRQAA